MQPEENISSKQERLNEFFRRLGVANAFRSFDEAYSSFCAMLDQVEDELSGLPNEPERWKDLDRLFPPQQDRMSSVSGSEVKRFDSLRHVTYIAPNGAIEVRSLARSNPVVFLSKAGGDGRTVCDVCPQLRGTNL